MISKSEIKHFIDEDRVSRIKQQARKGLEYYEGRHDIKEYKVYYYNEDGVLQEDKTKSNERISHPFFTELVDQCTQYILSGDTDIVRSDNAELQKKLSQYFNDEFKMELNDLLTYSSVEGHSYLYRYLGSDARSHFKLPKA